jgi:hypothetical protein
VIAKSLNGSGSSYDEIGSRHDVVAKTQDGIAKSYDELGMSSVKR